MIDKDKLVAGLLNVEKVLKSRVQLHDREPLLNALEDAIEEINVMPNTDTVTGIGTRIMGATVQKGRTISCCYDE